MTSVSNKFIDAFQEKEISTILNYYQSLFYFIFPVYHMMLKHYFYSFYKELFFLILEYLNILIFLFNKEVSIII